MNTRLRFLAILMFVILVTSGCSEKQKPVQPDTPANTAWLMKLAIDQGNYERFKELFADGRKDVITKEQFQAMKDLTTSGTSYVHYELAKFENGTMLLIRLTPEKDKGGKYYIEDVKKISNEFKSVFEP